MTKVTLPMVKFLDDERFMKLGTTNSGVRLFRKPYTFQKLPWRIEKLLASAGGSEKDHSKTLDTVMELSYRS